MTPRSTFLTSVAILGLFTVIWTVWLVATEPNDQIHSSLISDANNLVFAFATITTAYFISGKEKSSAPSNASASPVLFTKRSIVTRVLFITSGVLVLTNLFSAAFVRMADALENADQITFKAAGYVNLQREVGGSYFFLLTMIACLYFLVLGRSIDIPFKLTFSGAILSSILLIVVNSILSGHVQLLNGLVLPDLGRSETSKLVTSITEVGFLMILLCGFSFVWGGLLWIVAACGGLLRRIA